VAYLEFPSSKEYYSGVEQASHTQHHYFLFYLVIPKEFYRY